MRSVCAPLDEPVLSRAGLPERVARIDLGAIQANVERIRSMVSPSRVMAVVKANGYGHGMVPVAQAAIRGGAAWLGTAHVSEALELRGAGVSVPILTWLHTSETDFDAAIRSGIDVATSGWELAHIAQAARRLEQPARVQLKIDTGLGRNGATAENWDALLGQALELQESGLIRVTGIFSHLAVADEPHRTETDEQLAKFHEAIAMAEDAGLDVEVRHLANTPAALSRPDTHFDLVRVGIGMYGLSPFEHLSPADLGLVPAMTLATVVANAKNVPAGHGVSYGLRYTTPEATTLVLIPLGYADGIPRSASGGPVLVDGSKRAVVGTIAMDQLVVDMGRAYENPGDLVGSEAILFGAGGEQPLADEWARAAGTINYEIVTRIGPRVTREFVNSAEPQTPGEAQWQVTVATDSLEQTQSVAAQFAQALRPGDLIILDGELGAGKTTFTQGLGAGLGVEDGVISPTFVLQRVHRSLRGGPDLIHVDAYRLGEDPDALDSLDLESTLDTSVTVVEWGKERVEYLTPNFVEVSLRRETASPGHTHPADAEVQTDFSAEDEDQRTITFRAFGERWRGKPPQLTGAE